MLKLSRYQLKHTKRELTRKYIGRSRQCASAVVVRVNPTHYVRYLVKHIRFFDLVYFTLAEVGGNASQLLLRHFRSYAKSTDRVK